MLTIEHHIKIDAEVIKSPNLTDRFDPDDLKRIGMYVWDGYVLDKGSRSLWEKRTESAMDLALQLQKDKNFPWPNCSNVAFPLITVAAMQFHARAYPALIQGIDIVKCRIIGEDQDGSKMKRSERISTHMSYQVTEVDQPWEEQHDRLLLNISIVGCAFIKTRYSDKTLSNVSELVLARDLVVNYYAKSIEEANRKTHVIPLTRNEVHERVLRGTFRDVLDDDWYTGGSAIVPDQSSTGTDRRSGLTPPMQDDTTPLMALEQHCSIDLDGDGYAEPYIITIDAGSKEVLRIVTRFDREEDIERVQSGKRAGQIISVRSMEYFTKFGFIPSPDGSIYDIGFGVLTGPLNESVNSLVNQLIDAGTMANGGGGFLGRGAKIRGGDYTFAPFEWKRVDSTGDDLSKSIVPLQVRDPSPVLLNLLSLLINYTNRISGSTDMMVGENPGQNTPAETSRTMIEQGEKIYNALFKRTWRSMREEFKKLYILNAIYMPVKANYGESGAFALREDYLGDPSVVAPVADPNVTSESQRIQRAMAIKQNAQVTPGYDMKEVEMRLLKALHIEGIATLYPGPDKVPPLPNPKMQVEQIKMQGKQAQLEFDKQAFAMTLIEERKLNAAKIMELYAKATLELEKAGGVQTGHDIAMFEAQIGALKAGDESLARQVELVMKGVHYDRETAERARVQGVAGSSGDSGASGNA